MLRMTAHRADASLVCPVDVFTSPAIIDSKSNCDQYKNQDHRKGDPDFCVVTVGLEPTSVRSMVARSPWSGPRTPFRANKLESLHASHDSPPG